MYRDGLGGLTEQAFLADFANGIPREAARVLYAAQNPIAETLFGDRTTVAAWRSKPSRYLVTTEDRATSPDLQQYVARRMGARTVRVAAGHLSFVSRPAVAASLIRDAVRAAARS